MLQPFAYKCCCQPTMATATANELSDASREMCSEATLGLGLELELRGKSAALLLPASPSPCISTNSSSLACSFPSNFLLSFPAPPLYCICLQLLFLFGLLLSPLPLHRPPQSKPAIPLQLPPSTLTFLSLTLSLSAHSRQAITLPLPEPTHAHTLLHTHTRRTDRQTGA